MKERIDRQDDENIYQPKIHSDRIRELYELSQETHLPMTVLVDYALRGYFQAYQEEKNKQQANAESTSQDHFDQEQLEREFDDTDPWEDGGLYGF